MTVAPHVPVAPGTGDAQNPRYRAHLDGVRMIAVTSVLLYHGLVGWSQGGFLGVDVFFVLSGYLITCLLLEEWARWGSIDLIEFYRRRARRLFPALALVVTAVAVWAWRVADPSRLGSIRGDGIASVLYTANWRFVLVKQSYFDQYGDPSPFRHMWSLAIEEQYYLFFPLLMIGLLALSRRRPWVLPAVLTAIAVASIVEMALVFRAGTDPSRVYFGTDTRVHELMIGSLLAVVLTRRGQVVTLLRTIAPYAAMVALLLLLAAFATLTDQDEVLYRGGFAVVCLVTALLIAGLELAPRGLVARLLGLAPIAWVGRISYGLYIWHWPIFVALSPEHVSISGTRLLFLRLGITLVVSVASFYLVEQPIRHGALGQMPRTAGRTLAAVGLPIALVAVLVATAGATPQLLPDSPFGPAPVTSGQDSLLVVGDSVGLTLANGFPADRYPDWQLRSSTKLGCGLGPQTLAFDGTLGAPTPQCDTVFAAWKTSVSLTHPSNVLLSIGPWEIFDHVLDGAILSVGSPAYATYLTQRLTQAHDILTGDGAHLFIPDVPCYRQQNYSLAGVDIAPIRNDPNRAAAVNQVLHEFAKAHTDDTTVINQSSWLCPAGKQKDLVAGVTVHTDGVHYTRAGAALLWRRVLMPPILAAATTSTRIRVQGLGDSVPYGLYRNFPRVTYPQIEFGQETLLGCGLLPNHESIEGDKQPQPQDCASFTGKTVRDHVAAFQPQVGLVFAGVHEQFDTVVGSKVLSFGSPEFDTWLVGAIRDRVDLLRDQGAPVLLPTIPCHQVPDYGTNQIAGIINDQARVDKLNALLRKVADSYPGQKRPKVEVVNLASFLCPTGQYTNTVNGITLHTDGLHFTPEGAAYVWKFLAPKILSIAPKKAATDH